MTVVSFATSAPELIVSVQSAIDGFSDLALSNVIGSNIANLGLVLGITLLIAKIDVKKSFYTIDWPMMSAASLVLFFFVYDDLSITREGVILFLLLIIFLVFLLKFQKQAVVDEMPEDDEILPDYQTLLFSYFIRIFNGVGL